MTSPRAAVAPCVGAGGWSCSPPLREAPSIPGSGIGGSALTAHPYPAASPRVLAPLRGCAAATEREPRREVLGDFTKGMGLASRRLGWGPWGNGAADCREGMTV